LRPPNFGNGDDNWRRISISPPTSSSTTPRCSLWPRYCPPTASLSYKSKEPGKVDGRDLVQRWWKYARSPGRRELVRSGERAESPRDVGRPISRPPAQGLERK